jgi:hypothetical protein
MEPVWLLFGTRAATLPGRSIGFSWLVAVSLRRPPIMRVGFRGDFYRAHDTNLKATLRRKLRANEMEIHPGALLTSQPANPSRTYALPASTTAMENNPKNRPRRTAVRDKPIRLATCLDRSVAASGAIASMVSPCLPSRKLLSLAERLRWGGASSAEQAPAAASGAPGAGRAAPASGGSSGRAAAWGASLGERSKAVSEALRTVARAWGAASSDDDAGQETPSGHVIPAAITARLQIE